MFVHKWNRTGDWTILWCHHRRGNENYRCPITKKFVCKHLILSCQMQLMKQYTDVSVTEGNSWNFFAGSARRTVDFSTYNLTGDIFSTESSFYILSSNETNFGCRKFEGSPILHLSSVPDAGFCPVPTMTKLFVVRSKSSLRPIERGTALFN